MYETDSNNYVIGVVIGCVLIVLGLLFTLAPLSSRKPPEFDESNHAYPVIVLPSPWDDILLFLGLGLDAAGIALAVHSLRTKVSKKTAKRRRKWVFCSQCGTRNIEEANFCRKCGGYIRKPDPN